MPDSKLFGNTIPSNKTLEAVTYVTSSVTGWGSSQYLKFNYSYKNNEIEVHNIAEGKYIIHYNGSEVTNRFLRDFLKEVLSLDVEKRLNWEFDYAILDKDLNPSSY